MYKFRNGDIVTIMSSGYNNTSHPLFKTSISSRTELEKEYEAISVDYNDKYPHSSHQSDSGTVQIADTMYAASELKLIKSIETELDKAREIIYKD